MKRFVTERGWAMPRNALLAPEVASCGGAQGYMWRLFDVLRHCAGKTGQPPPALWTLNETPAVMATLSARAGGGPVFAGARSKIRFSARLLRGGAELGLPVEHVLVGVIGLAPLALALRAAGRIRAYTVILHGVEAWVRLPLQDRMACRHADRIVATTRFTAERFSAANGLDLRRVEVIPLSVEDGAPAPDPSFVLEGAFKVLTVGRQSAAERYKGFDELIEATRLLRARGLPLHVHLVGDGDDRPRLQALARECRVDGAVTFHGALDDSALQAAYAQCDVFALPSSGEGFGIVFLEAMRHGRPCVGARAGGIPEVLDHGRAGLLVPPDAVADLAGALAMLARDSDARTALGAAGRAWCTTQFSRERFVARHAAPLITTAAAS